MAEPLTKAYDTQRPDHIWSFRGYRLSPGEFNNAMIHFYRGEVTRSNVWRSRLDATTNWGVVATGAALSFAFSDPSRSHLMIPLNTMLVTLFCYIEARRYRYYELWSYRVRLMETDFFGAMLAPPFAPSDTWAARLVESLHHPTFPISFWEAFGRRFRRNYQFIFLLLALAWIVKIMLHPWPANSVDAMLRNAAVGPVNGVIVVTLGIIFNVILFSIGWLSAGLRNSKGEILRDVDADNPLALFRSAGAMINSSLAGTKREELAYIITSRKNGQVIADQIMATLARGVTAVEGKGMYTGEEKMVLFVAIHPDQVSHLKNTVRDVDPKAFVIIHHADAVIGRGFAPS